MSRPPVDVAGTTAVAVATTLLGPSPLPTVTSTRGVPKLVPAVLVVSRRPSVSAPAKQSAALPSTKRAVSASTRCWERKLPTQEYRLRVAPSVNAGEVASIERSAPVGAPRQARKATIVALS